MEPTLHTSGLGKNYGDLDAIAEPENYYLAGPVSRMSRTFSKCV